jgi:hypothetical protein
MATIMGLFMRNRYSRQDCPVCDGKGTAYCDAKRGTWVCTDPTCIKSGVIREGKLMIATDAGRADIATMLGWDADAMDWGLQSPDDSESRDGPVTALEVLRAQHRQNAPAVEERPAAAAFCENCGEQVSGNFCKHCGTPTT